MIHCTIHEVETMERMRLDVHRLDGVLGLWRCDVFDVLGHTIGYGVGSSRYQAVRRACRDAGSRRGLRVQ